MAILNSAGSSAIQDIGSLSSTGSSAKQDMVILSSAGSSTMQDIGSLSSAGSSAKKEMAILSSAGPRTIQDIGILSFTGSLECTKATCFSLRVGICGLVVEGRDGKLHTHEVVVYIM